ncbi:MAG: chorismate lyase [Gammaproteobacteria bacterium]|nr:chorismate lyase [Gammaproteobacteria bacterium]
MSTALMRTSDGIEWLPAERLGQWSVDSRLRPWLIGKGLLTGRLRAAWGARFELRPGDLWTGLLGAQIRRYLPTDDAAGLFREERLCCVERVAVITQVIVPDSTLDAHPWLAELGDSGVGETLEGLCAVEYSAYEYAWLPADEDLAARALRDTGHAGVWARRSRLRLRKAPFAVQELFLPGMGDL